MDAKAADLGSLSAAIRDRREVLGLTQDRLAALASLSRATVNDLENGAVNDLGINKVLRLLKVLGVAFKLEPTTSKTSPLKSNALKIAAKTASVSYKMELPAEELGLALRTGIVPEEFKAHIATLLDEASIPLVVRAVEGAFKSRVPKSAWRNIAKWATEYKSARDVWH